MLLFFSSFLSLGFQISQNLNIECEKRQIVKISLQLKARTETSEVKETAARNEYLLSMAAANAHHMRYYSTDLPEVMKVCLLLLVLFIGSLRLKLTLRKIAI